MKIAPSDQSELGIVVFNVLHFQKSGLDVPRVLSIKEGSWLPEGVLLGTLSNWEKNLLCTVQCH